MPTYLKGRLTYHEHNNVPLVSFQNVGNGVRNVCLTSDIISRLALVIIFLRMLWYASHVAQSTSRIPSPATLIRPCKMQCSNSKLSHFKTSSTFIEGTRCWADITHCFHISTSKIRIKCFTKFFFLYVLNIQIENFSNFYVFFFVFFNIFDRNP